jgi:hypothetical protein
MADDELQLSAQGPQSHHYAKAFRAALQETINSCEQLPSSVPQKTQLIILDSLHTFHAARCLSIFARKADETEEAKNKRWATFNDTLRRIIFGTYKATSLPPYVQTEIRELACPRWKSFFIQRILVYHSHVTSKKTMKLHPLRGTYDFENKIKTLPAAHFKDIKLPPPAQEPAPALPLPPPRPAQEPANPAAEAIVPEPEQNAQDGAPAAVAEAAPEAPLPNPPSQQSGKKIMKMSLPKAPAQGTTGIPASRPQRSKKTTRRRDDDDE